MLTATADQILTTLFIAAAGGEARRLVNLGAVKINGAKAMPDVLYTVTYGDVIEIGRNKSLR